MTAIGWTKGYRKLPECDQMSCCGVSCDNATKEKSKKFKNGQCAVYLIYWVRQANFLFHIAKTLQKGS
jgi:hypothetical protein